MKIAIVHEYLNQYGGAERVLECIHELFPDAPVYTLIHDPDSMPESYRKWDIRESKFFKSNFIRKKYKSLFFIYPLYMEHFDFREYDLVISSSYAYAHGIITSPGTCHISFCHTPMRFVWVQPEEYREKIPFLFRFPYDLLIHGLRIWDQSVSQRPDYYIAASQNVANRIKRYYSRDSVVIHPPVDTSRFQLTHERGEYYLLVSRLVLPYKRIDIAIDAFNQLGYPLKIVGDGTDREKLHNMSRSNIEFLGYKQSDELLDLYSRCKALIFPGEDDFGIVPLESNACGRPVIAYKAGGILETQIENQTVVYFDKPLTGSLMEAVRRFDSMEFYPEKIRQNALRFDKVIFKKNINEFISLSLSEYQSQFNFRIVHKL